MPNTIKCPLCGEIIFFGDLEKHVEKKHSITKQDLHSLTAGFVDEGRKISEDIMSRYSLKDLMSAMPFIMSDIILNTPYAMDDIDLSIEQFFFYQKEVVKLLLSEYMGEGKI